VLSPRRYRTHLASRIFEAERARTKVVTTAFWL
jgi:hypothetical protein